MLTSAFKSKSVLILGLNFFLKFILMQKYKSKIFENTQNKLILTVS